MSHTRTLCLVVPCLLLACSRAKVVIEQPEPTTDTSAPAVDPLVEHEAVREAVRGYAAALDTRDPTAAVELVVPETFDYYEDLRLAALRATREQLDAWDLMSVVSILQIRSQFVRSELEVANGRTLFEHAVREGLVGEEIDAIALDEVWLDDTGERAEIRIEGAPVVWLRKVEHWRIDIPEMIRLIGPAVEQMARERVVADGKVRTALALLELGTDDFIDIEVMDGPLDGPAPAEGD